MSNSLVGIAMGYNSDLQVMQEAVTLLEEFQISFEITIVSAHRTPNRLVEYSKSAQEKEIKGYGGELRE